MKKYKGLFLATGIILFISCLPISSYDFYLILRWFICGVSIFFAYTNYNDNKKIPFIEIAIAILFNPIYPIYMDKSSWVIFDIICGIYYIYLFYKESK